MLSVIVLIACLVTSGSAFNPKRWSPYSGSGDGHYVISEKAIDDAALKFLEAYGIKIGKPIGSHVKRKISKYCAAVDLTCQGYDVAVTTMTDANSRVDDDYTDLARYHFDAESFVQANTMLIKNKQAVFQQINGSQSYESARLLAGTTLHTLQDFYSHSNWVEMNQTSPHRKLTRQIDLGRIAAPDEATCSNCDLGTGQFTCYDNILQRILQEGILTSGYYGGQDIEKPAGVGKCSHGGEMDSSATVYATGGINKDVQIAIFSPHQYYQVESVNVASLATHQFFLDIWDIIGDDYFGMFLGLTETTSVIVVVDVTDSKILGQSIRKIVDIVDSQPSFDQFFLITVGADFFEVETFENAQPAELKIKLMNLLSPSPNKQINPSIFPAAVVQSLRLGQTTKEIFLFPSHSLPESECQNLRKEFRSLQSYQSVTISTFGTSSKCYDQLPFEIGSPKYARSSADVTLLQLATMAESSLAFSVESGLTNLVVTIKSDSAGLNDVTLVTPTGSTLTPNVDNKPTSVTFNVAKPAAGEYAMSIDFTGVYSISVTGQSNLSPIVQLGKFVASGNHMSGFIAFEGEPISDFNTSIVVNVGSSYEGSELYNIYTQLVGRRGIIFTGTEATGDMASDFIANVTTPGPGQSFQVLVRGSIVGETHGFQRMTSVVYTPVPFLIGAFRNADSSVDTSFLQVKVPLSITFAVAYFGDSDNELVKLTATLDLAGTAISSIAPDQVVVSSTNVTKQFVVTLSTEDDRLIGSVVTMQVFATDSSNRVNYVTRQFAIMPTVIDVMAPRFQKVWSDDSACFNLSQSLCHTESWSARASFYDTENGLHHYTLRLLSDISFSQNGTMRLAVSNFEKGTPNAVADGELAMDCCVAEVELIAIDTQGNLNSQYFSNVLKVFKLPEESALEWWWIFLGVVGGVTILGGATVGVIYFMRQ